MATKYYGGDGPPPYAIGVFKVSYGKDLQKQFTVYQEAYDFWESINDDAFLWNITRMPELCEGKTKVKSN